MSDEKNKVRKYPHEQYSPEWEIAAGNLARSFAPSVRSCRDCGAPVISGYCCTYCRSVNP